MKAICMVVQGDYETDPRVKRKADALVDAGYVVDVLALASSSGEKTYTANGVNVRTITLGKKRGSQARYIFEYVAFFLWALVRVTWQMRRRRYVIIDINTLPDFLIFAAAIARSMGAKLILDMHEITPEFYISKYGIAEDSIVSRFLKYQERISFAFADRVVTINAPIEDLLVGRGLSRAKSTIVMNAADEARFAGVPTAAVDGARQPGRFVMMYHGTLTKIYGLDIAIEAFALASADMPNAELWILGSGTDAAPLAALVQRLGLSAKVKLVGQVKSTEIPGWLSRCDAGILPIRRDVFLDFAFPNKLPEFIIMGKPVIVSRLKAIRHYFDEEALAYFEPNDRADLAAQMIRLYQHHELWPRLVAKAKDQYVPIRWQVMKQRYLTLIEEVAGHVTVEPPHKAETTALAQ